MCFNSFILRLYNFFYTKLYNHKKRTFFVRNLNYPTGFYLVKTFGGSVRVNRNSFNAPVLLLARTCSSLSVDFCGLNKNKPCIWLGIPLMIFTGHHCSFNYFEIKCLALCKMILQINAILSLVAHIACS